MQERQIRGDSFRVSTYVESPFPFYKSSWIYKRYRITANITIGIHSSPQSRAVKAFKKTTLSDHNLAVAENALGQDFSATKMNQRWVSDISVPQQAA